MIGSVGRAEALAAVALVVAARQEPVAGLRRLAAEDRSLAVLTRVADLCAAGSSLPEALHACRLIRRVELGPLARLAPDALADELTRLAQARAFPPLGEVLADWFPVWALLAATVPSLLVSGAVEVFANDFYRSYMFEVDLSYDGHDRLDRWWWLMQLGVTLLALAVVALDWWLIRTLPVLRLLSRFPGDHHRARCREQLLRTVRAGGDAQREFERWARVSGGAQLARAELARSGDVPTAVIALGLVPRHENGEPDWDTAIAEAARDRAATAASVAPWLGAGIVVAGVVGFFFCGVAPIDPWWGRDSPFDEAGKATVELLGLGSRSPLRGFVSQLVLEIALAAAATVVAYYLASLVVVVSRLSGPARDWPLVADRVARALTRREPLDPLLAGLRLCVGGPMRQRLSRALGRDDPHPGRRLVAAGVVPLAQRRALWGADPLDLPTLLHAAAETPDDHGVRVAVRQAAVVALLALAVAGVQAAWLGGAMRLTRIFASVHLDGTLPLTLISLGQWTSFAAAAIALTAGIVLAFGLRFGLWSEIGGWARRARGLVARRLLARCANEADVARAATELAPRARSALTEAGARGDLAAVLAALGWHARTPAELDRALAADIVREDRRRARLGLIARIVLPLFLGVPVALIAAGQMSAVTLLQAQAWGRIGGGLAYGGGSPAQMLLYWATKRYEDQGEAVVEDVRARERPPLKRRDLPKAPWR